MKYATSLTLGGELVDAEKCNYSSFKDLMLTCPVCRSPVFLRKESQRTIQSKSVQVQPHWCHFQEDKNFPMACENRMKGVSKLAFAQSQSQARGQRLKFFQSKALSIWNEVKKQGQTNLMNALGKTFTPDESWIKDYISEMLPLITKLKEQVKLCVGTLHEEDEIEIQDFPGSPVKKIAYTQYECFFWDEEVNFEGYNPSIIDRKIGMEYLSFLCSKRQSQLFSEILAEICLTIEGYGESNENITEKSFIGDCAYETMKLFGDTNWTQVFAAIGNSHSPHLPLIASKKIE